MPKTRKDPTFCTRVIVQDVSWTGSITNSSPYTPIQVHWFLQDIFWQNSCVFLSHGWGDGSTHVWLPMWCVMRLAIHVDLLNLSLRYKDWVQLHVVFYISNRLISESGHLASYVSCHNAMAYDTCPYKWSYQTWKLCKKTFIRKNSYCNDLGGHARCKIVLLYKSARFCESRRKRNRIYCSDIFAFYL